MLRRYTNMYTRNHSPRTVNAFQFTVAIALASLTVLVPDFASFFNYELWGIYSVEFTMESGKYVCTLFRYLLSYIIILSSVCIMGSSRD